MNYARPDEDTSGRNHGERWLYYCNRRRQASTDSTNKVEEFVKMVLTIVNQSGIRNVLCRSYGSARAGSLLTQ